MRVFADFFFQLTLLPPYSLFACRGITNKNKDLPVDGNNIKKTQRGRQRGRFKHGSKGDMITKTISAQMISNNAKELSIYYFGF